MPNIDKVWNRIKAHEGDDFETKRGKPLTYKINDKILHTSRTKRHIHKNEFKKALKHVPCDGPGVLSNMVQGSSYIWAILHDKRIRKKDW